MIFLFVFVFILCSFTNISGRIKPATGSIQEPCGVLKQAVKSTIKAAQQYVFLLAPITGKVSTFPWIFTVISASSSPTIPIIGERKVLEDHSNTKQLNHATKHNAGSLVSSESPMWLVGWFFFFRNTQCCQLLVQHQKVFQHQNRKINLSTLPSLRAPSSFTHLRAVICAGKSFPG